MKQNIFQKRIPTLLGVMVIAASALITSVLVRQSAIFQGRAMLSDTPENIRITNITSNSFTVSYMTSKKVPGTILYGKDKNASEKEAFDQRDEKGTTQAYNLHTVSVKNLDPSTKYFFNIVSGEQTKSALFEVTTASSIASVAKAPIVITGKVILPDGNTPHEALVYVVVENSQMLSTFVDSNGHYSIALDILKTADLSSDVVLSDRSVIHMLILGDSMQSTVTLLAKQQDQVSTITLSQNYDFTTSASFLHTLDSSSSANTRLPSLPATSSVSSIQPIEITTPKQNETFTDQQPLFKGVASPNTTVEIVIRSDELRGQVKTDANGRWTFRPKTPLAPGQHTIIITTVSLAGKKKTITRLFTVFASGSQVTASATPSATPTSIVVPTTKPVPTSLPKPTPTLIPSPTSVPTPIPPTLTQTPLPTITPTMIPQVTPTPIVGQPPIPSPGNSSVTFLGIGAAITTVIGLALFFLTRGGATL